MDVMMNVTMSAISDYILLGFLQQGCIFVSLVHWLGTATCKTVQYLQYVCKNVPYHNFVYRIGTR